VIKVIMLAVIGLVLGLGGGTGFALMRAKKPVAAAVDGEEKKEPVKDGDEKHGDEAKTPGPEGTDRAASSTADSPAPAARTEPKHDSVAAGPRTPTVAPVSAAAVPAAGTAKAVATDTSRTGVPAPGRIAKIFAAMSAKDAARVLQQLDDADVQTVLGGLNDKQAAAILSGFPPERAAAISRAVLRGKKGAS
jgi:MgtE-like protein